MMLWPDFVRALMFGEGPLAKITLGPYTFGCPVKPAFGVIQHGKTYTPPLQTSLWMVPSLVQIWDPPSDSGRNVTHDPWSTILDTEARGRVTSMTWKVAPIVRPFVHRSSTEVIPFSVIFFPQAVRKVLSPPVSTGPTALSGAAQTEAPESMMTSVLVPLGLPSEMEHKSPYSSGHPLDPHAAGIALSPPFLRARRGLPSRDPSRDGLQKCSGPCLGPWGPLWRPFRGS